MTYITTEPKTIKTVKVTAKNHFIVGLKPGVTAIATKKEITYLQPSIKKDEWVIDGYSVAFIQTIYETENGSYDASDIVEIEDVTVSNYRQDQLNIHMNKSQSIWKNFQPLATNLTLNQCADLINTTYDNEAIDIDIKFDVYGSDTEKQIKTFYKRCQKLAKLTNRIVSEPMQRIEQGNTFENQYIVVLTKF